MPRSLVRGVFIAVVGAVLFLSLGRSQEIPTEGVAALVNNEVVTFSEVREVVRSTERQARETLKGDALVEKIREIRLAAVNDLVDRILILQEAKRVGQTVPEDLIDERITGVIRDSANGDRQAFLRGLNAQGFTFDKFRANQRDSLMVEKMKRQVARETAAASEQNAGETQVREWLIKLRKKAYFKIFWPE